MTLTRINLHPSTLVLIHVCSCSTRCTISRCKFNTRQAWVCSPTTSSVDAFLRLKVILVGIRMYQIDKLTEEASDCNLPSNRFCHNWRCTTSGRKITFAIPRTLIKRLMIDWVTDIYVSKSYKTYIWSTAVLEKDNKWKWSLTKSCLPSRWNVLKSELRYICNFPTNIGGLRGCARREASCQPGIQELPGLFRVSINRVVPTATDKCWLSSWSLIQRRAVYHFIRML